ncbi:MAG TPA: DUF2934 domain-containing protein [Candidatus Methylacidiphilales bacterium]
MKGVIETVEAADKSEIESLAFFIWQQEGRPEGQAWEHWREAECIIRSQARSHEADEDAHGEIKVRSRGLGSR